MPDTFTSLGFSDVTTNILKSSIPPPSPSVPWFLGFQIGNMILSSIVRSKYSGKIAQQNNDFTNELQELRNQYAEEQHQNDISSLRAFNKLMLIHQSESNSLLIKSRHLKQEFTYFCNNNWNQTFAINIQPLLNEHDNVKQEQNNGLPKIRIIVARTPVTEKIFPHGADTRQAYTDFCNQMSLSMNGIDGFNLGYLPAWNYSCTRGFFSDVMKLYYIMQGIPTLVLNPIESSDGKSIAVYFAYWTLTSGYGGLKMGHLISFDDIDNIYQDKDKTLLINRLIALCLYFKDCESNIIEMSESNSITEQINSIMPNWFDERYRELKDITEKTISQRIDLINKF